ncbi:hypothetical protein [Magnetospirillum sp. 15-1]|uniref:hypothetical protein n=1 Tax=Magnetospirillum sp. 15-1 TaxID=1979370 RepID=UPI000BBBE504|nr:hypothetical protein [Magnetospirillum sp. 15-1]
MRDLWTAYGNTILRDLWWQHDPAMARLMQAYALVNAESMDDIIWSQFEQAYWNGVTGLDLADLTEFAAANGYWVCVYVVNDLLSILQYDVEETSYSRQRVRDVGDLPMLYWMMGRKGDLSTRLEEPDLNPWKDAPQAFEDMTDEEYEAYAAKYPERLPPYAEAAQ